MSQLSQFLLIRTPRHSKGIINVNGLAHEGGIDLDHLQRAKPLKTVIFRFLNFQETPFQA